MAASTTLSLLKRENHRPFGDNAVLYGRGKPAFLVLKPGNGVTLGFAATRMAEVDAFHTAGLAAGVTKGRQVRVDTCRVPTLATGAIREAIRSARTPSSDRVA